MTELYASALERLALEKHFYPSPLFGLQNVGNTCYFNSGLQLLCSSVEFVSTLGTVFESGVFSDSQLYQKIVAKSKVESTHLHIWWQIYSILWRSFAAHFDDVEFELKRRVADRCDSGSDVAQKFIENNVPRVAVVQFGGVIVPSALLDFFARAHPVFEGMAQQDTSEMINQILSSLDDASRIDQLPHYLLASFLSTEHYSSARSLSPSSLRKLQTIALMHLINLDNARKDAHASTFKQIVNKLTDSASADVRHLYETELTNTLLHNPPSVPRLFTSAHNNMFRGYHLTSVLCQRCLNTSCTVQEFTSLTLDIPSDAARKRFAAENPDFVFKMRHRWRYDAQSHTWTEKHFVVPPMPRCEVEPERKAPSRVAFGLKSIRMLSKGSLLAVAGCFFNGWIRNGSSLMDYAHRSMRSTSTKVMLAISASAIMIGMATKFLTSQGLHSSTESAVKDCRKKLTYLNSVLKQSHVISVGLSDEERTAFVANCKKRIEKEEQVLQNLFSLFGESSFLDKTNNLEHEAYFPHPSEDYCRFAYMSHIRRCASQTGCAAAKELLFRGKHNGNSLLSKGEIDYPLTIDECLAIYTSESEINVHMDAHVDSTSCKTPNAFRCENCCYGGTSWRREGHTTVEEWLSSRVTADVRVRTQILSLPQNLVIHLKRIRPPDDIVDSEGGNSFLTKISDPVLFPHSGEVASISLEGDATAIHHDFLEMGRFVDSVPRTFVQTLFSERSPFPPLLDDDVGALCKDLLAKGVSVVPNQRYRLASVVNHHGDASGGHYTTFSNRVVGQNASAEGHEYAWLNFNDSSYSDISIDVVVSDSVCKGSVFLFQQIRDDVRVGEKDVMLRARCLLSELQPSKKQGTVRVPRWWLQQASVVNEPGPIWNKISYVSQPSDGRQGCVSNKSATLFRPMTSIVSDYPEEWFYVEVPRSDAVHMLRVFGGDISI